MDNAFSQISGDQVPTGQEQEAVDAAPSEQSGTNVQIGTPVWKSFVQNKAFQEANREGVRAEQEQIRRSDSFNRRAATQSQAPDVWKGSGGKLLRKSRGQPGEMMDAESYVDHPEAGGEARKSLWDREIKSDRKQASDAAFMLRDPLFHAQEVKDADREAMVMEGSLLQEADPRHVELKAKVAAGDAYKTKKAELAQMAWDSEARARQTEAMDPEAWWQGKETEKINANRQPIVADAQAKHSEADQAAQSLEQEKAALAARMAQGVKGSELAGVQAQQAEHAQADEVIMGQKQAADVQIEGVKQAAVATPPAQSDDTSDTWRGVKTSIAQLPQLGYGVAGLIGQTMESVTGYGKGMKDWGLRKYQESERAMAPMSRENDSLSKAWSKATQNGDVGALVDFAQYGLGYVVGQGIETAGIAVLGGAIGGAATAETGPGAVVGGGVGAIGAALGKGAFKTAAKEMIEKAISGQALKIATKAAGKEAAAENIAKLAASTAVRKTAGKEVGSTVAMLMNGTLMELGSIYPEAKAQADSEGREMTRADVARVWVTGLGAGAIEGLTDKLGIDLLKGKYAGKIASALPGSISGTGARIASAAVGGLADAAVEGSTEAIQTGIERLGAKKSLTDDEAKRDYVDSAGLGVIGGGAVGGVGGLVGGRAASNQKTDPPSIKPDVDTALAAIDPTSAPATEDEIHAAEFISRPEDGSAGVADSVLIERELAQIKVDDEASLTAADQAVADATASGDKIAITAAETARESLQTGRASTARAVLKIAAGQELDELTTAELDSLGIEAKEGEPDETGSPTIDFSEKQPAKGQPATPKMIRLGADGSNVLTDEALEVVAAVSPRARGRVKMSEAEAIQKAKARAAQQVSTTQDATQGEPAGGSKSPGGVGGPIETNAPVEFDVPMKDGTSLRVQAPDASTALEEAAAQAAITGQEATPVPNVQDHQRQAQAQSQDPAPASSPSLPLLPANPAQPTSPSQPAQAPVTELVSPTRINVGDQVKIGGGIRTVTAVEKAGDSAKVTFDDGGAVTGGAFLQVERVVAAEISPENEQRTNTAQQASPTERTAEKATPAGTPGGAGQAQVDSAPDIKAVVAQAKAKLTQAKKSPKLGARLLVTNDPAILAEVNPSDGIIRINPDRVISGAVKAGMSKDQASEYFSRVLDEEIHHAAQLDAARTLWKLSRSPDALNDWREAHYSGIWQSDFSGDKGDVVRNLYVNYDPSASAADKAVAQAKWDSMSEGYKALEAIRMMAQGDKVTEAAKLWLGNLSQSLIAALKAALASLKKFREAASPTLQNEIKNLENALRTLTGTPNQGAAIARNPQPQPNRETADTRTGQATEAPSPKPAPIGSGASATQRDAFGASSFNVGQRVEFVRDGERLTGVITYEGSKQVRVKLDDGKLVDGMDKVMAFKVDAILFDSDTKPQESPVIVGSAPNISEKTENKKSEEYEKRLAEIEEDYRRSIDSAEIFFGNKATEKEKDYPKYSARVKAAAMIRAAAMRELTGNLTAKEQQAKDAYEATNYVGKLVSVDGKNGEVLKTAFGKVVVKFKDGTKKGFTSDKIEEPVEAAELTRNTPEAANAVTDKFSVAQIDAAEDLAKFIQSQSSILSDAAFQAAALSELQKSLEDVSVTLKVDVAGQNSTAEIFAKGSDIFRKLKTEKTSYSALAKCLGKS